MNTLKSLFQLSIIAAICIGLIFNPFTVIAQGETSTIQGYVLDENGNPNVHAGVVAIPPGTVVVPPDNKYAAGPNEDGFYSIGDLIPGSYIVSACMEGHVCGYYGGSRYIEEATILDLSAGETINDINISLEPAGSISGTVFDQQQNPLANKYILVNGFDDNWPLGYTGVTASDGTYTMVGVPTGNFQVCAYDPDGIYFSQFYNEIKAECLAWGHIKPIRAIPVQVEAPYETTGVNFTLELKNPEIVLESGPRVWVWLESGLIEGYSWPLGSSVTLTIDDPSNGPGVDYTDTQTVPQSPWNPDSTYVAFNIVGGFQLTPGQEIALTDGTTIKTLIVTRPALTDVDSDTNTVYGVAEPSSIVKVFLCWGGSCGGNTRETIADQDGNWSVNFGIPGDGLPAVDFPPGTTGLINEMNESGNGTMVFWRMPTFSVQANTDTVIAYNWPLGEAINLEIDDPATTQDPDYTATQTVTDSSTPLVFFSGGVFDIQSGLIVRLQAGSYLKSLMVSPLALTNVNIEDDTLSGIATPNSRIDLQTGNSWPWINRHVIADEFGFWSADFGHPGIESDEQTTFNLIGGNWVTIAEWNNHYNQTIFSEAIPSPTSIISGNAGVAGATLSYDDSGAQTAIADSLGDYSFSVSYNWSGTVTPSLSGYTFSPVSNTYTNILSNQTDQNYIGFLPASNVQASDGIYTDKVLVSWNASSGATSYQVYRASSATGTKSLLGSATGHTFKDTTATPGITYYYWVKACIDANCSDYGTSDAGWRSTVSRPTNVQASDGTDTAKVLVSWRASSGATSYKVYRASSATGTKSLLGSPMGTSLNDTTATPGVTYYYWVVSYKGTGYSDYSISDTGWRKLSPPTNLQASDGTYIDKVLVSWIASIGATSYQVYRATTSTGTKSLLGSPTGTTFDDTTATPGVTYYFWVKACIDANCSDYSSYNTGWRKISPPTNVQASDGTDTTKVMVSWDASSGATSYKVYRATSTAGTKSLLGSPTGITFNDTAATPGVTYFYWVVAYRSIRYSDTSISDTGWRKISPPTNVQASDGTYTNKVLVSWNASSGATSYQVHRAETSTGTKDLLGSPTATSFNDTTATPGVIYYYWVVANRSTSNSDTSNSDTGWRKLSPPTNIQASDGTNIDKVLVSWNASIGATSYQVYRANSSTGTKSLLGNPTGTAFEDATATPKVPYYYWVKACSDIRCSDYSANNTGWRKQPLQTYLLSVSIAGAGNGTVTSSPSGINCGPTCSYSFNYNSIVTLTATPSTGSTFIGWSDACTGTDTCKTTMNGDVSVTATFDLSPTKTLVVAGFPSPTTAGEEHELTVTAKDTYGNTATGYTDMVHFTSSDSQAVLPGDYTFVPSDHGTKIFSATLKTAESTQVIIATDTVIGTITGTQSGIEVTPAEASMLEVRGFPSPTTAGEEHDFTVTAKDAYGNTATNYTGTIHFASSDTEAVLPGDYSFVPDDNGIKTFSTTLKTAGSDQWITATDTVTGTITGTQSGIEVTPAVVVLGHITFNRLQDGNWEIYIMDADGSNPVNISNNPAADYHPFWSPDGKKIAFASHRDGNWELYVMDKDGSNTIQLTNDTSMDHDYPAWSPDGTKIAFQGGRGIDSNDVWVMNSDGSGSPVNLTGSYPGDSGYPSWSPNSSKIAFSTSRDGQWEIYTMNAEGSNPVNLTNSPADDTFQAWSPEGSRIAFGSMRDGNWEVYVMDADGSNQIRLTNDPTSDCYVYSWMSEADILFSSKRDGPFNIYAINADNPEPYPHTAPDYPRRLTDSDMEDAFPVWTPY